MVHASVDRLQAALARQNSAAVTARPDLALEAAAVAVRRGQQVQAVIADTAALGAAAVVVPMPDLAQAARPTPGQPEELEATAPRARAGVPVARSVWQALQALQAPAAVVAAVAVKQVQGWRNPAALGVPVRSGDLTEPAAEAVVAAQLPARAPVVPAALAVYAAAAAELPVMTAAQRTMAATAVKVVFA